MMLLMLMPIVMLMLLPVVCSQLLSHIELKVTETDLNNVVLLIKTQNIIYRRFSADVSDQKYPAYPLLIR